MPTFTKIGFLSLGLVFAGFSCINITVNGVDIPVDEFMEESPDDETSMMVDDDSDTVIYENSAGYRFTYPANSTLWEEIDTNLNLVPADATSAVVNIATDEGPMLTQTDGVPKLTFEVVPSSSMETLKLRADLIPVAYPILNGNLAIDMYGENNIGSPYRVLAVPLGDSGQSLIVTETAQNEMLDEIIQSLTIELEATDINLIDIF